MGLNEEDAGFAFNLLIAVVSIICMRFSFAVTLLMCATAMVCNRGENSAPSVDTLASVPGPDPNLYAHVQDASDWQNPYILVLAEGLQVECRAVGVGRTIPVSALKETLMRLPRSAWPYGRIVAGNESGVRSQGDTPRIEKNRMQVDEALKSMNIKVEWWGSA